MIKYKVIVDGGNVEWYLNGLLHREDGPAVLIGVAKYWYKHGKIHREDGPASEVDGHQFWRINGLLHREDGPAVVYNDGEKHWYLNGKFIKKELPQKDITITITHEQATSLVAWITHGRLPDCGLRLTSAYDAVKHIQEKLNEQ